MEDLTSLKSNSKTAKKNIQYYMPNEIAEFKAYTEKPKYKRDGKNDKF